MRHSLLPILDKIEALKIKSVALDLQIDSCKTEADLNRVGAEIAEIESELNPLNHVVTEHTELAKALISSEVKIASARKRL